MDEEQVEIKRLILECKKCSTIRTFDLNPPLRMIDQFEEFMSHVDPCQKCGHNRCEISVQIAVLN